ncbi:PREDICTED: zinc finger BED domain-containing [Prunus dulcis]|uniref:PREDICTED: zinc finger BED domain-containing n=1 Tax=Prunus dulcis TaxID=3755 RepID=A0A5E4F3Z7_PRUDU|nr:PREDICTED: zinc finger BED domain-containing [Prunus dulcis]
MWQQGGMSLIRCLLVHLIIKMCLLGWQTRMLHLLLTLMSLRGMGKKKKKTLVKRVGPPTESDWENAQAFVHFLKEFYETTLKFSATKTCISKIMFTELVGLQVEIERKIKDEGNETLQKVASSMKLKCDKYWGSFEGVNKLAFIGNVLGPRWKLALLKISFYNLESEPSKVETIGDEVKLALLTLYNEYKGVGTLGPLQTLDEGDKEGLEDALDGDDAHSQMLREMLL